jgi:hypothetical protein
VGNVLGLGPVDLAKELFGSGRIEMKHNADPFGQMVQYLAQQQQQAPPPGWAGFKWKPYHFSEEYVRALQ